MSDHFRHYGCGCREVPTPNGFGMAFCAKHTPIRENKKKKKRRGQVLSAFESEHYYYILYDSRGTSNNNFTLKIMFKSGSNKIISIMGVDNILDKLNKDINVEQKDYLKVEKHLLEGII